MSSFKTAHWRRQGEVCSWLPWGQPWEPGSGLLCGSHQTSLEPTLNLAAWEIRQKMLRLSVKASAVIWSEQMTCTHRQREMKAFRAGEH